MFSNHHQKVGCAVKVILKSESNQIQFAAAPNHKQYGGVDIVPNRYILTTIATSQQMREVIFIKQYNKEG